MENNCSTFTADNMIYLDRILIHKHADNKWYVWGARSDIMYHSPDRNATAFNDRISAELYASKRSEELNLSSSIYYLSDDEIIKSLRFEMDSPYCQVCRACGEDGCCSGSICVKNKCLYGEHYVTEFEYNKELCSRLYDEMNIINPARLEVVFNETYDKYYPHNQL